MNAPRKQGRRGICLCCGSPFVQHDQETEYAGVCRYCRRTVRYQRAMRDRTLLYGPNRKRMVHPRWELS